MKKTKLEIITSEGMAVLCDCKLISLPSIEGTIEIMPGHEPILIQLMEGEIVYINDNEIQKFPISSGFAMVNYTECKILSVTF
jgi:F0F1-type ATP synthase epsilon subunit